MGVLGAGRWTGPQWGLTKRGFAVLVLISIWMYNGKRVRHSRAIRCACCAFYPAHLLILGSLAKVICGGVKGGCVQLTESKGEPGSSARALFIVSREGESGE